jgi:hypothetical protein
MGGPSFNTTVEGVSTNGFGVHGTSTSHIGVGGRSPSGRGVVGESDSGTGVQGLSDSSYGVVGRSGGPLNERLFQLAGVRGDSPNRTGVFGISGSSEGVRGESIEREGVFGTSSSGVGVRGKSERAGVLGESVDGVGVQGNSSTNYGVIATSTNSVGLFGSGAFLAAHLKGNVKIEGNVEITGTLNKDGGRFKIDHPLDPANKYLSHSFVESPDMKNVYDGVVVLDDKGEAEIELPDWFGALNKDFRYQLTAIGAPGPNLYIAEEISSDGVTTTTSYYYSNSNSSNNSNKNKNNNSSSRFKVAGGISGMKVSWQVTGIRKDPWANANRIRVEEDKPAKERGYYTYPELYGQPEEKGISRLLFPGDEEEKKELFINNQNKRPKIKIPSS